MGASNCLSRVFGSGDLTTSLGVQTNPKPLSLDKTPILFARHSQGFFKVLGKGVLPKQPVIVKAKFFSKIAGTLTLALALARAHAYNNGQESSKLWRSNDLFPFQNISPRAHPPSPTVESKIKAVGGACVVAA